MRKVKYYLFLVLIYILSACNNPTEDFETAQKENTVEAFRSFFEKYKGDYSIRMEAIEKIDNQNVLAMIVIEDEDVRIRKSALLKTNDQKAITEIILKCMDVEITDSAWIKLNDQSILMSLADTVEAAGIRIRAVYKINNDDFLLKRSINDISASVREAAVEQIKSEEKLTEVAINSYYVDLRELAASRVSEKIFLDRIRQNHEDLRKKIAGIKAELNQDLLYNLALSNQYEVICITAVNKLIDQTLLASVSIKSQDRNVTRIALSKIDKKEMLEKVSNGASDNAVRIAATIKLGQKSWDQIFSNESKSDYSLKAIGDFLAAVSLLPDQVDIGNLVTEACLTLIKNGDESRIPELVELLHTYGDVNLAEDYLNCGQPDLDGAGRVWANNHGYNIGTGAGSNRARWGSSN
jgi:hypothetical protein